MDKIGLVGAAPALPDTWAATAIRCVDDGWSHDQLVVHERSRYPAPARKR